MSIKLCKDCKWSEFEFNWICKNPKLQPPINLVTGNTEKAYCEAERSIEAEGGCGKEGKLWEERNDEPGNR